MTILVIAEHNNAALGAATLNTVTAAKAIGGDVEVLVAGSNCGAAAEAAAKVDGVAKVLVADMQHTSISWLKTWANWLLNWVRATATSWPLRPLPVKTSCHALQLC